MTRILAKNYTHAQSILGDVGMSLSRKDGECRVNFRGGKEATAYYTNDVQDAVDTGMNMSLRLLSVNPAINPTLPAPVDILSSRLPECLQEDHLTTREEESSY